MPGSCNYVNVVDRSAILDQFLSSNVTFKINGNVYRQGYYLVDCIYPDITVFMKTISSAVKKQFAASQEAVRKDIERAFGILK
ncbi:TPA: hypothetical protein N0F65_004977 [Lagenidium giganteum]|uniref:Uncharacterized protein n=1 Tax=Lagenidium giganteum TaxID=4803 RepID=A0AAV2ZKY0_9STRA|nr:TPA: hypothetical protein N0F65_004977 [Lagenidium giganteum]